MNKIVFFAYLTKFISFLVDVVGEEGVSPSARGLSIWGLPVPLVLEVLGLLDKIPPSLLSERDIPRVSLLPVVRRESFGLACC